MLNYLRHLTAFNGALHNPNTLLNRLRLVIDGTRNAEHLGANSILAQKQLVNVVNEARPNSPP